MAATSSSSFKNAKTKRALYTESTFRSGMKYTNVPLQSGYVKNLVNYTIKDDGNVLTPRGGWRVKKEIQTPGADTVHSVGLTFMQVDKDAEGNTVDGISSICRYALLGLKKENTLTNTRALIEVGDEDHRIVYPTNYNESIRFSNSGVPIHTNIEGTTYLLGNGLHDRTLRDGLCYLDIHSDFNGVYPEYGRVAMYDNWSGDMQRIAREKGMLNNVLALVHPPGDGSAIRPDLTIVMGDGKLALTPSTQAYVSDNILSNGIDDFNSFTLGTTLSDSGAVSDANVRRPGVSKSYAIDVVPDEEYTYIIGSTLANAGRVYVKENTMYTISAYVYCTQDTRVQIGCAINSGLQTSEYTSDVPAATWTRIQHTFDTADSVLAAVSCTIGGTGGTVYVCDMQLEQNNTMTEYTNFIVNPSTTDSVSLTPSTYMNRMYVFGYFGFLSTWIALNKATLEYTREEVLELVNVVNPIQELQITPTCTDVFWVNKKGGPLIDSLYVLPSWAISYNSENKRLFNIVGQEVTCANITTDFSSNTLSFDVRYVEPKVVSTTQALNYGYNMWLTNPYDFKPQVSTANALVLEGVIPYNAVGDIVFSSKVGEVIVFKLTYQHPSTAPGYRVQWEIKDLDTDTDPTVLQYVRDSKVYTAGQEISYTFAPMYKRFSLIVKVYDTTVVDALTFTSYRNDELTLEPLKALTLSSYSLTTDNSTSKPSQMAVYNLKTAQGMTNWKNRLVLWGIQGAETTLFVSDAGVPEYMPYPNNCEVFDAPIVSCIVYMDNLLVFTTNKIHILSWDATGLSYTSKCAQANLDILLEDAKYIQPVKNMVYFKSGRYFYMVVPKATVAGAVQLAPVTTPVEEIFNDLNKYVLAMVEEIYNLNEVYREQFAGNFSHYEIVQQDSYNYTVSSTVRNVYVYKILAYKNIGLQPVVSYFNVELNYDTNTRVWTTAIHSSSGTATVPYKITVTEGMQYIHLVEAQENVNASYTQLLYVDEQNPEDDNLSNVGGVHFGNYQYIETGNRDIISPTKKRFREVQFSVNNTAQELLNFYSVFEVDGELRRDIYDYQIIHNTDPNSGLYGTIDISRALSNSVIPNTTRLNSWYLDFSKFPGLSVVKARLKVSGKGYNANLKLLCKTQKPYELLNMSWVYRVMNAR